MIARMYGAWHSILSQSLVTVVKDCWLGQVKAALTVSNPENLTVRGVAKRGVFFLTSNPGSAR